MTGIWMVILMLLLQAVLGMGILCWLKVRQAAPVFFSVAVLLGMAVFSLVPFFLQLLYVPISGTTITAAMVLAVAAAVWLMYRSHGSIRLGKRPFSFRLHLYEVPQLALIGVLMLISIWRCWYLPPTPRDLTSGPEAVAEYAVEEQSLINTVFTLDLESTNNHFKPAYITSLQVIYKLGGVPFGQVWLSVISVAFLVFLYGVLRSRLHPMLASFLLLVFVANPEMYAYTFMALFDYPNAVYFTLAVFFLLCFLRTADTGSLLLSSLMLGIAVYIRPETLLLMVLLLPLLITVPRRKAAPLWRDAVLLMVPGVLAYLVAVKLYIAYYLPPPYPVEAYFNWAGLTDLKGLAARFWKMNTQLLFSSTGLRYYGYFTYVFLIVLLADLITSRWSRTAVILVAVIGVIYIGLPLIGFLIPLFDLEHSTKRGLFKMFPLMLLYCSGSSSLRWLSGIIKRWEGA